MNVLIYIVIFVTLCIGWTPLSESNSGERWAVLVAGSNKWFNYVHQACVCHAYKILRKKGLKEDNIIVFMYDDIAYNLKNMNPRKIYNDLKGDDVYQGVPKDYTGEYVTSQNFYNVLNGRKNDTIGHAKVLKSGPNDNVFIYFAGHGCKNFLDMPQEGDGIRRHDFLSVLRQMHVNALYKQMVVYVDACASASMFKDADQELDDMNIFVTTASNPDGYSYFCFYIEEWRVFLSTKFSDAWMKDCERHNLRKTTFNQQYERVKKKVAENKIWNSIVMKFGSKRIGEQYIGEFFQKA